MLEEMANKQIKQKLNQKFLREDKMPKEMKMTLVKLYHNLMLSKTQTKKFLTMFLLKKDSNNQNKLSIGFMLDIQMVEVDSAEKDFLTMKKAKTHLLKMNRRIEVILLSNQLLMIEQEMRQKFLTRLNKLNKRLVTMMKSKHKWQSKEFMIELIFFQLILVKKLRLKYLMHS